MMNEDDNLDQSMLSDMKLDNEEETQMDFTPEPPMSCRNGESYFNDSFRISQY